MCYLGNVLYLDQTVPTLLQLICNWFPCLYETQLDEARTQEDVDATLVEKYMSASCWDLTKAITCVTKHNLVQGLNIEEVIVKKEKQIQALKGGLEWSGFLDLIRKYPEKMHPLFVHDGQKLTYEDFQELITENIPNQLDEKKAHEWFTDYIARCADEPAGK